MYLCIETQTPENQENNLELQSESLPKESIEAETDTEKHRSTSIVDVKPEYFEKVNDSSDTSLEKKDRTNKREQRSASVISVDVDTGVTSIRIESESPQCDQKIADEIEANAKSEEKTRIEHLQHMSEQETQLGPGKPKGESQDYENQSSTEEEEEDPALEAIKVQLANDTSMVRKLY